MPSGKEVAGAFLTGVGKGISRYQSLRELRQQQAIAGEETTFRRGVALAGLRGDEARLRQGSARLGVTTGRLALDREKFEADQAEVERLRDMPEQVQAMKDPANALVSYGPDIEMWPKAVLAQHFPGVYKTVHQPDYDLDEAVSTIGKLYDLNQKLSGAGAQATAQSKELKRWQSLVDKARKRFMDITTRVDSLGDPVKHDLGNMTFRDYTIQNYGVDPDVPPDAGGSPDLQAQQGQGAPGEVGALGDPNQVAFDSQALTKALEIMDIEKPNWKAIAGGYDQAFADKIKVEWEKLRSLLNAKSAGTGGGKGN